MIEYTSSSPDDGSVVSEPMTPAPRGPKVRFSIRRTRRDDSGAEILPPAGMIDVDTAEVSVGQVIQCAGGGSYTVDTQGRVRRLDKPRKMSKKERRMRRATLKAVRASRPQD